MSADFISLSHRQTMIISFYGSTAPDHKTRSQPLQYRDTDIDLHRQKKLYWQYVDLLQLAVALTKLNLKDD